MRRQTSRRFPSFDKMFCPKIFPSQSKRGKLLKRLSKPSPQRIHRFRQPHNQTRCRPPAIFANTSMLYTFQSDNQILSIVGRSYRLRIRRDELTQNARLAGDGRETTRLHNIHEERPLRNYMPAQRP
jgi:hypothetical protein